MEKIKMTVNQGKLLLRLVLYGKELYALPGEAREIKIISGSAWLTLQGKDVLLCKGDTLELEPNRDRVLVSPLNNNQLIFEIRGVAQQRAFNRLLNPNPFKISYRKLR